MSSFETFSNAELRQKLLACGYDIPVSVSKEFMIRKLEKVKKEKEKLEKGTNSGRVHGLTSRRTLTPSLPPLSTAESDYESQSDGEIFEEQEVQQQKPPEPKRKRRTRKVSESDECDGRSRSAVSNISNINNTNRPLTRASIGRVSARPIIKKELSSPVSSPLTPNQKVIKAEIENRRFTIDSRKNSQNPSSYNQPQFSPVAIQNNNNTEQVNQSARPASMFGLIVSGRLVQTNFVPNREVAPNKFQIEIPQADKADHIVLFLTGSEPFPAGSAGQIYLGWNNANNQIGHWFMLGHITNERPSAIYKISELRNPCHHPSLQNQALSPGYNFPFHTAQLGISIEPLEVILQAYCPQLQI